MYLNQPIKRTFTSSIKVLIIYTSQAGSILTISRVSQSINPYRGAAGVLGAPALTGPLMLVFHSCLLHPGLHPYRNPSSDANTTDPSGRSAGEELMAPPAVKQPTGSPVESERERRRPSLPPKYSTLRISSITGVE